MLWRQRDTASVLAHRPGSRDRALRTIAMAGLLGLLAASSARSSTIIGGGNLNGTLTQAGSPYVVTGNVTVSTSLTVEAGVVVRFRSALYMLVSGTLTTQGTVGQPVTFTSDPDTVGGQPAPGNWYGLRSQDGAVLALGNTFVRYGGFGSTANLSSLSGTISSLTWYGGGCGYSARDGIGVASAATTLTDLTVQNNARNGITLTTPTNAAATLTGLTILANAGDGINLSPSGPLSTNVFDQLVISNNVGRAIAITQNATSIPWGTLSGSGNGTNGIYVTGTMWGSSRKWEWSGASPNFPYVLDNLLVSNGDTLALAAGAVMKFLPSGHLYVSVAGSGSALRTLGTTDNPVWFTSIKDDTRGGDTNGDGGASVPAPGDYVGVTCYGTSVLSLAQTWMVYGGAGNAANLSSASGTTMSSLTWNGGGCSYSAYDGIQVTSSATTLSGLTVQNNARNGITLMTPTNAAATLTGLTILANAVHGINLHPSGPLSTSVFDQLVISNNVGRAIAITQNATSIPWGALSGSGNGTNGIYVTGTMWGSSRKWEWSGASPNFPYVLDNLQVSNGDTLALAAGAVVKFLPSGHLYVSVAGSGSALRTLGTADKPVWFTSIKDDTRGGDTNGDGGASVPAPGDFVGVTCYGTSVLSLAQTWMAYGGAGNAANLSSASGTTMSSLTWNGGGCSYSAYDGIQVTSSATTLSGLTVQNNARNGITLTTPINAAATLTGLTIMANAGNGINLAPSGPLSVSMLDQLVLSDNIGRAIAIAGNATSISWGTLSGSGNGTTGIYVTGIMWGSNRKWEWGGASPNFPYVPDNLQVSNGDTLVIAAGAVLKFLPSGRLYLNVAGSGAALQTLGTEENPVWFTSIKDDTRGGDTNSDVRRTVPAPGDYVGITCYGTSVLSLAQTWMAYGGAGSAANLSSSTGTISSLTWNGGGCSYSAYDGIGVTSSATTLTGLAVQNNARNGITLTTPTNAAATLTGLTVRANAGNGISFAPSGPLSTNVFDQLVVSHNGGRAIAITGNVTAIPWGALSGSGNGTNGIHVMGTMWGSNRKWEWSGASPNFPYVLDNLQVSNGDTLAIEAGAVLKFLPSGHLYLNVAGSGSALQTLGTTDNPVWFTSIKDDTQGGDTNGDGGASVPARGDYVGITCYGTSVLSLAQTWIANGGAGSSANISSYTGTISSLTWNGGGCISSASRGISVSTSSLSMNGVRFASNTTDGAYITPGSNGSATGCDFNGNGGAYYGLYNSSTAYTIDASNSWWGDPLGPNDPSAGPPDSNPNPPGSRVSDFVIYRPWATVSQTVEPPRSFALLGPLPGGVAYWNPAELRWSHSSSPDGGAISYRLTVDDDPAFDSPEVDLAGLADTSFAVAGLDTLGVYYWKVLAQNTRGGQRLSCPVSSWFRTLSPSDVPEHGIEEAPRVFRLGQPVPNPFQDWNSIHFSLPVSAEVQLQVYDVAGRLVRTVMDGRRAPGDHVAVWDGSDMAGRRAGNGVYFYRFRSQVDSGVRRVVLIR